MKIFPRNGKSKIHETKEDETKMHVHAGPSNVSIQITTLFI